MGAAGESGLEAGSTLWRWSRCPESPSGGTTRSFPGLSWVCLGRWVVIVPSGRPSLGTLGPGQGSGPGSFCPVSRGGCCCGGCVSRGLQSSLSPAVGDLCPKVLGVPGPVRDTLCRPPPGPGWPLGCPSVLIPPSQGAEGAPARGAVGSPLGAAGCAVMATPEAGTWRLALHGAVKEKERLCLPSPLGP